MFHFSFFLERAEELRIFILIEGKNGPLQTNPPTPDQVVGGWINKKKSLRKEHRASLT
jgi:hypothetical protein